MYKIIPEHMTAKEYLQQYRNADRAINTRLDQIHRLRELATKTTQTLTADRVQSSPENRVERIVSKIADLENEVDSEIDQLGDIRRQVQGVIEQVPNAAQREVLTRRYMIGERWEEIAVELNYDYRWVLKLHGRALDEIRNRPLKDISNCDIL